MMKKTNVIVSLCCLILLFVTANQGFAANQSPADQETGVTEALVAKKIDINLADEEMLTDLPGIGPRTATRIHEYRKVNGPFKTVEDLLKIKGIGPKVLEKLRPFVRVS